MSDTYVVVATQLNRVTKTDAGDEFGLLKRGETFTSEDVTAAELKRWLEMRPKVIATEAELEEAAATRKAAAEQLAEAQSQIADLQAQLAAALAAGAEHAPSAQSGGDLQEPGGNASREEWAAYALQQDPDNAEFINDEGTSRNDLRDAYKSA